MSMVCVATLNSISGRIKAINGPKIVVTSERGRGETYNVDINSQTRFVNSNSNPGTKGLKVKDHVIVDVHETEGKLIAIEIVMSVQGAEGLLTRSYRPVTRPSRVRSR
jgi:hypothetical protein